MTDAARFWNGIAEKYAASRISDEAAYQRKLEATRAVMPEGAAVLELACGTGTTALWHAGHAGHIRAIDISKEMIRIAREKAAAQGVSNVDFEVATIAGLDAPDGAFDMIMAHSILHLVEDLDATIARCFRLLKPGGHFVSSTICMADGLWFLRPVLPLMRLAGKAPAVWFFSAGTLRAGIRSAGFEIVQEMAAGPRKALFLIARKPGGD